MSLILYQKIKSLTFIQRNPIKIIFGFAPQGSEYGVMLYHRNRLIKSYEKVGYQKQVKKLIFTGFGIIQSVAGVIVLIMCVCIPVCVHLALLVEWRVLFGPRLGLCFLSAVKFTIRHTDSLLSCTDKSCWHANCFIKKYWSVQLNLESVCPFVNFNFFVKPFKILV